MGGRVARTAEPAQSVVLGEIMPSEAVTKTWAETMVKRQRAALLAQRLPVTDSEARGRLPPTEQEFVEGVRRAQAIRKALARGDYYGPPGVANVARMRGERYRPTPAGYIQFLTDFFERKDIGLGPLFSEVLALAPRPVLDPRARNGHTSVVGGSDAGKSELMKALALHDIQSGAAVVVIDPHQRLARQVARWPEVATSGRLVWMGEEHNGQTARFNPLDVRGLSLRDKEKAAFSLVETLGDLVDGAEPSRLMASMALNCLRLVMEHDGGTLLTLRDMLTADGAKEWAARGAKHPSENVAHYFRHEFLTREKEVTRDALRNRVNMLTESDAFTSRFCQPSTIDLAAMLDARKVIVFDLYDLAGKAQVAGARLILGALAGWAKRRDLATIERAVPVHVYLDEAHEMLGVGTGTILRETRKMGLFLTLASQRESADLRTGTAVRFAGGNLWRHALADTPAAFGKDDKNMRQGMFWVNWANRVPPFKLQVRSDLRDGAHAVDAATWAKVLQEQHAAYYRPPVRRGNVLAGPAAEETAAPLKRQKRPR